MGEQRTSNERATRSERSASAWVKLSCSARSTRSWRPPSAAAVAAAQQQLPDLTGSELQIVWATTLRAEALAVLDAVTDYLDHEHADRDSDRDREIRAILAAMRTVYLATTSAKVWIDYRTYQRDPARLADILVTAEQKAELVRLAPQGWRLHATIRVALSRRNRLATRET